MHILYIIYQALIALPIMLVVTILAAVITIIMAPIFGRDFWGWWPAKIWGWLFCHVFLLPVHVEGNERLDPKQAYVLVANHQSVFDILLMLGFVRHPFKWMMKKELMRIPLVGFACKCCGFISISRNSKDGIADSMHKADATLRSHHTLAMFAEGTRTRTGHVGPFKRGAFKLAVELGLPVVPISLNGCYEAMPKGRYYVRRTPLKMIIHDPIYPTSSDPAEMDRLRQATREAVLSALDEQYR